MSPATTGDSILSIVIPTRNRREYARAAVASILRIPDPDLEVVVQDNSDEPGLRDQLQPAGGDPRLRYAYIATPLSFVGNFEAAVRSSSGRYVCVIGDDDAVLPEIMEAARWAEEHQVDALTPASCAHYLWPHSGISSTLFTVVPQESGYLTLGPFTGRLSRPDPQREMRRVVRSGGQNYLSTRIPKLYHGIVARSCLEKVREQTGVYFGGLSPDIFAALSVANFAVHPVSLDYPLTLPGACRASGSVQSQVGGHTGKLEDAPHLKHRGPYEWSSLVPRYYSVPTIWADSTVAALRLLGREDLLREFNVAALAAQCLWQDPPYRKIILADYYRALGVMGRSRLQGTAQLGGRLWVAPVRSVFRRGVNRACMALGMLPRTEYRDLAEIGEAVTLLEAHLRRTGWSVTRLLAAAGPQRG